jgi:hypothetical protein
LGRVDVPVIFLLDVLDGTASLNATNRKASRVCEAAHHPRLPLQGTLQRLVELGRALQINNVDIPIRRANHTEILLNVQRVHPVLTRHTRRRALLPHIPVLDRLIPTPRHDHGSALVLEETHGAHRLVVCADDDVALGA